MEGTREIAMALRPMEPVRRRGLAGDIVVSEIGFAVWGSGATRFHRPDERECQRALMEAFHQGITLYDTSDAGTGQGERLIGNTFAGRRGQIVLAAKAHATCPTDALEASLRRLRTDHLDLLMVPITPIWQDVWARLELLKQQGKVRALGLSLRSPEEGLAALELCRPDALHLTLNAMDQRPVFSGLMAAAEALEIAVLARLPICLGLLGEHDASDIAFAPGDSRSRWPRPRLQRWLDGSRRFLMRHTGDSPAQVALRFCLSFPGVASAIPAIASAEEAREYAAASARGPLPAADIARIHAIYEEEGLPIPLPRIGGWAQTK